MELDIQVSMGKASEVRLDLRCSDAGKTGASITINNEGLLSVGKSTTLLGKNERHRLRIFLDKRVFEIYADDGIAALYSTTDAGPNDLNIAASAKGEGAALTAIQAWPLKPARFDLNRFRI
jgi:sucrose-6-phosphate hydrolase SacC (GH32 family)